jgi:hypothetical protein
MLVELAAANAAFAVIKEAISHSGEIVSAGKAVFDYFDAKAALQRKSNSKGNKSELEEFMALETLRQQEERLREEMIYAGRPGMWEDWLQFQARAAREREARKRAEIQARIERMTFVKTFAQYTLISILVTAIAAVITWISVRLLGRV